MALDRRRFLAISALSPLAAMAITGTAQAAPASRHPAAHSFGFAADGSAFLLDGQPFQIRSGEMHPARIPVEYWQHRIAMAKAMGLNTVSLYVMWNYVEVREGVFDFTLRASQHRARSSGCARPRACGCCCVPARTCAANGISAASPPTCCATRTSSCASTPRPIRATWPPSRRYVNALIPHGSSR